MYKVLFVCMGNICRSPSAEAVFRELVKGRGLESSFVIDSAGTHGYHIGNPPDRRSIAAAARRGVDMRDLRARRFEAVDFERFDYLLAMDNDNRARMLALADGESQQQKLSLMLDYADTELTEVPDPYYGELDGFEQVLDLLEEACTGLLQAIVEQERGL